MRSKITKRIKLADPNITEKDKQAVISVLESGWLVKGPQNCNFEEALKENTGRKHAVALSSGTMALLAAMKSFGIGSDSTVIVPALTFPAPAFAASFLGATIKIVDVDPKNFNISQETLAPHINENTSLVVAIDQFGMPAPIEEIEQKLKAYNIPVLADAACSLGSTVNGKNCGCLGLASTLSFHPRKIITTGEGGALLTDDDQLASRVRMLVDQGIEKGKFKSIGLNMRLSEVNAAIGVEQLKRLKEIVQQRRALAKQYMDLPLRFQQDSHGYLSNYQTLVALLPPGSSSEDRVGFIAYLGKHGIESSIASYCLGKDSALAKTFNIDYKDTPVAAEIHDIGVALPLHPGLNIQDIDEIKEVVHDWLKLHGEKND